MVTGTGDGRDAPLQFPPEPFLPTAAQHIPAAQHMAIAFSSPADLSARLAPRIRGAVAVGDPVLAVLAHDVREELRGALGPDADAVEFADPGGVHSLPAFTVAVRWARQSRRVTRPGGRALVVGQRLDGLPGCGPGHWARLDIGLDVATAGLPVIVVCPFAGDAPDLPQVRATHRVVGTSRGLEASPDYRAPHEAVADYPPPPPPELGPPEAELWFGAERLGEVRHLVARCAEAAGLDPDRVADVVLAVNELASNSVEHGPGSGRLRMWAAHDLTAEVVNAGPMHVPFPGLELPPVDGARGRGLWLASELCEVLQVWSDDEQTVIRVRVDR